MPARRCTKCDINWPTVSFASGGRCGICGTAVYYDSAAEPISQDEARSLKAHADFERWLEAETPADREQRRARYARELAERAARSEAFERLASTAS